MPFPFEVSPSNHLEGRKARHDPAIIADQTRVRDYDKSRIELLGDLLRGWREFDSGWTSDLAFGARVRSSTGLFSRGCRPIRIVAW